MLIKYWIRAKSHFLLTVSLIAACIILINCFNGISSINKSKVLKYSNESMYYICDNFTGEKEQSFFSSQNCIKKLKDFNRWLTDNGDFEYLCIRNQSISINNKSYDSIQVNQLFFEKNDIEIIGEQFSDKNYSIESMEDEIPILLGESFMGKYEIGDKIEFYYLGSNKFKGFVKGFVSKESCYKDNEQVYSLEKKIIIPLLEFEKEPQNRSEWSLQLRLYLDRNSGALISDYPVAYLQSILTSKCAELKIEPYIIQNHIYYNLNAWGLSGNNLLEMYQLFVFFLTVMLGVILSLETVEKFIKLRKKYSIAYYSGFSEIQILSSIIIGIFIEIFKPFIIAILIDLCIFGSVHIYAAIVGVAFLLAVTASICMIAVHKKISFDERGTRYGNNKT